MNRIKRITLILLLLAALAGVATNQRAVNRHEASLRALTRTLDFQSILPACGIITDGIGHGSCVAIGPDLILIAGHCIGDGGSWIEIGGIKYDILEEWASEQYDVGFVRIDGQVPYLQLGEMPRLLDTVYLIGTPINIAFTNRITKGIVSKFDLKYSDPIVDWTGDFLCDCAAYRGNSGGPVLNQSGQIVGIYVGLFNVMDNFSVCVPVDHILEALGEYNAAH